MSARRAPGPIHLEDSVWSPRRPDRDRLRDGFFPAIRVLTLGLLRGRSWRIALGGITVHEFGEPEPTAGGWRWPIRGGLLTARPGGSLAYEWREGRLTATVDGYWPSLPRPVYRLTQLPIHHLITQLYLLQLRGRVPPPGVPAGPAQRLAAGAVDVLLCAAVAAPLPRRRPAAFAGVAVGYHLSAWSLNGRTLGGLLLGLRVVSVDGSRVRLVQSLLRLVALPLSLVRFRDVHDQLALTEVIEAGSQEASASGR
jgi:hypothetical protein